RPGGRHHRRDRCPVRGHPGRIALRRSGVRAHERAPEDAVPGCTAPGARGSPGRRLCRAGGRRRALLRPDHADRCSESPEEKAETMTQPKLATRAIRAGQAPDPVTGAVITPIYATSTYAQQAPGVHQGYDYARSHNLTRYAYERCVADLECAKHGFAFSSGMAAIGAVLEL